MSSAKSIPPPRSSLRNTRTKNLATVITTYQHCDETTFFLLALFSHHIHQDLRTHVSVLIELFEDRRDVPYAKLKEFFP